MMCPQHTADGRGLCQPRAPSIAGAPSLPMGTSAPVGAWLQTRARCTSRKELDDLCPQQFPVWAKSCRGTCRSTQPATGLGAGAGQRGRWRRGVMPAGRAQREQGSCVPAALPLRVSHGPRSEGTRVSGWAQLWLLDAGTVCKFASSRENEEEKQRDYPPRPPWCMAQGALPRVVGTVSVTC